MRKSATKTRGKAIIIDGNALFNMMRIIGVGTWRDKALYDILIDGIGTSPPFGKPYITCKPEHTSKGKALELIGYEVEYAESRGGYDDQCIRKRIQNLSSKEVDQIVFVGADEDMVGDLLKCVQCGIKVLFVATRKKDPQSGNSMLAGHLQELIDNGTFSFFELHDKKEYLMKEPWKDREPRQPQLVGRGTRFVLRQNGAATQEASQRRNGKFVKIVLEGCHEESLAALLSRAGEFADQFNLRLSVSVGTSLASLVDSEVVAQDTYTEKDGESQALVDPS